MRIIVRTSLALVAVVALAVAIVWPWPAPEVDWRTPADQALAAGDCKTAVKIVDVAAGAGSTEAYRIVRTLTEGGQCDGQPVDRAHLYNAFISLFRQSAGTTDSVYGLDDNDLGLLRHHYVSAAIFLCVDPYNGMRRIDNVAISDTVPASQGPIMAFHRLRRETCLTFLEQLAEQLVDANDAPAHEVAYLLLMYPPIVETSQANFLFARLLLEKRFVAAPMLRRDDDAQRQQGAIRIVRDFAWSRLERAAQDGNVQAIRLMITLLHEGRYRERDDKKAYFWILRLRRQGGNHPRAQDIEAALSDDDRTDVQLRDANCPISETIC